MASRRTPSPLETAEQPAIPLLMDFEAYLRRAEQQKALAQEMIKKVHDMCNRAEEMRKRPRLIFP